MADTLDAVAILQPYSRLVIDCNRPFESPTSIALISEDTPIPGNVKLTAGRHELKVFANRQFFNLAAIRIEREDVAQAKAPATPYGGALWAVPGRIQAEKFAKKMSLATADEVRDLKRTVRSLEDQVAALKRNS